MSAEWGSRQPVPNEIPTRPAARVAEHAARQFGVVSLGQLRACGLSRTTIMAWADDGRLHRVERGVYAVGHRALTARGWWMASALACGDDALIGFRSGLAVYGVVNPVSRVDVITTTDRGRGLPGIRARRCAVAPDERTTFHGLPVTTLARTFIDAATQLTDERLGMALNEAIHLELYDHSEMTAALERHRGRRGVARVRAALGDVGDEALRFRSRAEARARALVVEAGLPVPEMNAWFATRVGHGHELDLFWRDLRLNVEIDGPRHALPWQQRKDRLRDADLAAAGVLVVRIPAELVEQDPLAVVARIAAALRRVGFSSGQG